MEKRGVINGDTPLGTCCGGGCKGPKGEAGVDGDQLLLKFGEASQPETEKEADDMADSTVSRAVDAVAEETQQDGE
jgi:hypothetical protein